MATDQTRHDEVTQATVETERVMRPQEVPVNIRIVGDISLLGPRVRKETTSVALGSIDQKAGLTHTVYLHIKGPHRAMTNVEVERVEPASLMATLEARS